MKGSSSIGLLALGLFLAGVVLIGGSIRFKELGFNPIMEKERAEMDVLREQAEHYRQLVGNLEQERDDLLEDLLEWQETVRLQGLAIRVMEAKLQGGPALSGGPEPDGEGP